MKKLEKYWNMYGFRFCVKRKLGTPMVSVILFNLRRVPREPVCKIDTYGLYCSDMTGSMFA